MVSTRGRYALRVMLDLAIQGVDGYIPLDEIAARQGISKKYLEAVLKVLVKRGLLKGLRGKGGGYRLTRSPADYTVGEILDLTEGSMAIVSCLENEFDPCERRPTCLTYPMWKKFDQMAHDFFNGITLQDLMPSDKETSPEP